MDVRRCMYPESIWIVIRRAIQLCAVIRCASLPCAPVPAEASSFCCAASRACFLPLISSCCFARVVGELCLVAQHGACIAIKCRCPQTRFTLGYVQFALQRGNFLFLAIDLLLQFFVFCFCASRRIFLGVLLVCVFGVGALVVGFSGRFGFAACGRRGAVRHAVVIQLYRARTGMLLRAIRARHISQAIVARTPRPPNRHTAKISKSFFINITLGSFFPIILQLQLKRFSCFPWPETIG